MKPILLGSSILAGVVGLGSAGVYFARPLLTAAVPGAAESQQVAVAETLTPVPLGAAPANPFARSNPPQRVAVADDRYTTANTHAGGDDGLQNDIPNAAGVEEMPATRAPDAFGLRERPATSRYAEQTVSAETIEPEAADESAGELEPVDEPAPATSNEPRRLTASNTDTSADRYRRPLDEENVAQGAEEPTLAEPVEEQPEATAPRETIEQPVIDPPAEEATESDEGTGRPGAPQLSGSQAPNLTIEKSAPPEIQIGKPAKFVIKVRNTGSVVAHGVEVHDSIPQGTQLIDTTPPAKREGQGTLVWDLGSMKPGAEQTAELQVMPMNEGEIGSVATVHFRAEASVRTMATKPMLNLEVFAPSKVMKGEEVTLKIKLSNPGSGSATGVVLSETVPEGLKHASGPELEFEVGTLKPGETRELELGLTASEAGTITNVIAAHADANLEAEARTELEVVAAQLQVSMNGPKRRYLERNATHNISVTNPGTASAKDIELAAALPKELKFVEANNGGMYDAATHSVYWSLEELPPQETGTVKLVTLPQQPGEARLTIKSTSKSGLKDQRDEVLSIEGLAAINFQLSDINDPIEVGGETAYEVRVTNQGTKAATNVRLVAIVPAEMKPVSAEGPVRYKIDGQRIVFEPLKQLAPKADTAFTIKVKSLEAGDLRLQAQISTDEIRDPITKEESTRVYGDE